LKDKDKWLHDELESNKENLEAAKAFLDYFSDSFRNNQSEHELYL